MTVYVDAARWEWSGHLWAHLVSDEDLDELHAFAREVGLRYLSFGLDHYDIPEFALDVAIGLGAEAVSSRELARRLVSSGLRRRVGHGARRWRLAAGGAAPFDPKVFASVEVPGGGVTAGSIVRAVDAGLAHVPGGEWRLLWRPSETVVMLQWDPSSVDAADHADVAGVVAELAGDTADRVVTARDPRGATVELVVVA
ncbi:MAG: DUF4031 domain-containing protein [Acidimicrobiales bacterium]